MTAEIPKQAGGQCMDCNQAINVTRNANRGLQLSCACDDRSIKVTQVLPEEWDV